MAARRTARPQAVLTMAWVLAIAAILGLACATRGKRAGIGPDGRHMNGAPMYGGGDAYGGMGYGYGNGTGW